jgi:MFS family permease
LFGACFLARAISGQLLRTKYEPKLKVEQGYHFSLWQFIKKMRHNNFGRFVITISLMNLVIHFASPFFVVYMLEELKFSYSTYMLIIVSSIVGNLIFMPVWGRFADRYGNVRTIKITSFLTCLVPLLWFASFFLFKTNNNLVPYLSIVEFLSGAIFAGFGLATSNFIYDAVTRQRMALCSSYFNFINSIGIFLGATLAGVFATHFQFGYISVFLVLFLISGILRAIFSLIYVRTINEVRMVEPFKFINIPDKIKDMTPERLWQYLDVFNFNAEG